MYQCEYTHTETEKHTTFHFMYQHEYTHTVTEEETIFHFMYQCEYTQSFWAKFERWLKKEVLTVIDFQ